MWGWDAIAMTGLLSLHSQAVESLWKGSAAYSLSCKTGEYVSPVDANPDSNKLGGLSGDF